MSTLGPMKAKPKNVAGRRVAMLYPPEQLVSPGTKSAYAYWLKKRGDRLMPQPREIDALELSPLLPFLSVIEVLDGPPVEYFFRIDGEGTRAVFGYQRMGHRLSEFEALLGTRYKHTAQLFDRVCAARAPGAGRARLDALSRDFYEIEWIHMPLSHDGEKVNRIFSCIAVLDGPQA